MQVFDMGDTQDQLLRPREQQICTPQSMTNPCYLTERKGTFIAVSNVDEILREDNSIMKNGGNHFFSNLLSPREFQSWGCLSHPLRRREWLIVRLLVKYMVLSGITKPLSSTSGPMIQFVDHSDILAGDTSAFCRAEFLSSVKGKEPRLFWLEEDMSPFVSCSASHSEGWVAVALTTGDYHLGVDIEKVKSFSDAFRMSCFSDQEQAWIELNSATSSMSREDLCTLLWTFKEAAFKAGGVGKGFLLRTDVNVKTVIEKPLPLLGQTKEIPEMAYIDLEVFINGWQGAQGASCFITGDRLLSVLTVKKGEKKHYENN